MPELVIVNPSSAQVYGPLHDTLAAVEPPIWCRMIAGYLRGHGYDAGILDAEALRLFSGSGCGFDHCGQSQIGMFGSTWMC